MRELLQDISSWFERGDRAALATVVSTWGSSPRPAGSMMAVSSDRKISGSVSGGCVEGAVIETALKVLSGAPACLMHFGVSDENAWGVGLACGGSIDVFVAPLSEADFQRIQRFVEAKLPFLTAIVIVGPEGLVGNRVIAQAGQVGPVRDELKPMVEWLEPRLDDLLAQAAPNRASIKNDPDFDIFINIFRPPERLVIVGGVHIAIALANLAQSIGYETIVIDPRRLFASEDRFSGIKELIQAWPQEALADIDLTPSTAVVVLTHDPKIDDPALIAALASPAFYIGVLGSRKTHAARVKRLKKAGVTQTAIARLHAPIGLDLGAQSPEEIALATLAEIVASKRRH